MSTPEYPSNNYDRRLHSEDLQLDPVFRSLLKKARALQQRVLEATDEDMEAIGNEIRDLQSKLDDYEWIDTTARVSGKLRVRSNIFASEEILEMFKQRAGVNMLRLFDETGEYFMATDTELVCKGFSMNWDDGDDDDDSDPTKRHIVLAMELPEDNDEDEAAETSSLYMELDGDIGSIGFRSRSLEGVKDILKHFYPGIFTYLEKHFYPNMTYKAVSSVLKRTEIRYDIKGTNTYDVLELVGQYIYETIGFDRVPHEIMFDGPIESIARNGDLLESEKDRQFEKLSPADIVDIKLEVTLEDPTLYRPALIAAVPTPGTEDSYHGYSIPAESLLQIRGLRPHTTHMGARALQSFDSPRDIRLYFKGFLEFDADTEPEDFNEPEEKNETLPTLGSDIVTAVDAYEAFAKIYVHLEPAARADAISRALKPTFAGLTQLKIGDTLCCDQSMIVMDEPEAAEATTYLTERGDHLEGAVVGFAVTNVPDFMMHVTQGEQQSFEDGLCIIVDSQLIDEATEDAPTTRRILVPLTKAHADMLYKKEATV